MGRKATKQTHKQTHKQTTIRAQLKQSNQLSISWQSDWNARRETTNALQSKKQHNINSDNGGCNKQWINKPEPLP